MDVEKIVTIILAVGALIMGAGYAYAQFFRGKRDQSFEAIRASNETLDNLLKQVSALQNLVDSQEDKITNLSIKIGHLEKVIDERDKKLEEFIKIFQGRNPEFENFMKDTKSTLEHIKTGVDRLIGVPKTL